MKSLKTSKKLFNYWRFELPQFEEKVCVHIVENEEKTKHCSRILSGSTGFSQDIQELLERAHQSALLERSFETYEKCRASLSIVWSSSGSSARSLLIFSTEYMTVE